MKRINLSYLAGALIMILAASCEKEESFTLEDTSHLDNVLVAQASGFNDELYSFDVQLASEGVSGKDGSYSGNGEVVALKLFGSKYYLDSAVYSPVEEGKEGENTYLVGTAKYYTVSGGNVTAKSVKDGFFYVNADGNSYRFGSTLRMDGGEEFKFVSGCDITFPKLPKYKYANNFIQTYEQNGLFMVEFATGSVKLQSDGTLSGDGMKFHLEINGLTSLVDGVYKPGDYKAGFLNDTYAAWGAVWDEGSRFSDVKGGVETTSGYITDAVITISTESDGSRKILIDMDDVVYVFQGKI